MSDRLSVRVEFKKALWICPKCATEDIEDMNPAGGNKYEHNCSKCGIWFNSFKEYNGVLQYPLKDYEKIDPGDIEKEKIDIMAKWIEEIKNPVVPKEPTKEDMIREKEDLERKREEDLKRILDLSDKISAMAVEAPIEEPIEEIKP